VRRSLAELSYFVSFVYLVGISAVLFAISLDVLTPEEIKDFSLRGWWLPLIYALGSAALLLGVYFISLIWQAIKRGRLIRAGPNGSIQIAPSAIRELIGGILKEELGVTNFKIGLSCEREGIRIRVKASLWGGNVVEMGKQIQNILKGRVEEEVGVSVKEVKVLAQSIVRAKESKDES
jgi:uncharacterized alkaline shock family protein YloU